MLGGSSPQGTYAGAGSKVAGDVDEQNGGESGKKNCGDEGTEDPDNVQSMDDAQYSSSGKGREALEVEVPSRFQAFVLAMNIDLDCSASPDEEDPN